MKLYNAILTTFFTVSHSSLAMLSRPCKMPSVVVLAKRLKHETFFFRHTDIIAQVAGKELKLREVLDAVNDAVIYAAFDCVGELAYFNKAIAYREAKL